MWEIKVSSLEVEMARFKFGGLIIFPSFIQSELMDGRTQTFLLELLLTKLVDFFIHVEGMEWFQFGNKVNYKSRFLMNLENRN